MGQLACLHPAGGAEQAPFRLHATRGADVALSGELDLTTVDLFAAAVDRTGLANGAAEIVVDATGLEFADHRNLLVLERMADRYGRTVVLRTARRWPARLVAALDLSHVRVEPGHPIVIAGRRSATNGHARFPSSSIDNENPDLLSSR